MRRQGAPHDEEEVHETTRRALDISPITSPHRVDEVADVDDDDDDDDEMILPQPHPRPTGPQEEENRSAARLADDAEVDVDPEGAWFWGS